MTRQWARLCVGPARVLWGDPHNEMAALSLACVCCRVSGECSLRTHLCGAGAHLGCILLTFTQGTILTLRAFSHFAAQVRVPGGGADAVRCG